MGLYRRGPDNGGKAWKCEFDAHFYPVIANYNFLTTCKILTFKSFVVFQLKVGISVVLQVSAPYNSIHISGLPSPVWRSGGSLRE